jgi:hypothetical protein
LQDRKQCFVEDLRNIGAWDRPGEFNPGAITLVRTWSRVGHAQMLEQCINWVHTEYYLSMHDDIVVMDKSWSRSLSDFDADPRLAAKTWGPALLRKTQRAGATFELPHFNTIFTLCSKPLMRMAGATWAGYHFNKRFRVSDYFDYSEFMALHESLGSLETNHPELSIREDCAYDACSMDIGTFVYSQLARKGLRVSRFPDSQVTHFEAVSWRNQSAAYKVHPEVADLEREIMSIPQYRVIYERYREDVDA